MSNLEYEQRISEQIAQYANDEDMHDLPPIYRYWEDNYLGPALETVFLSRLHTEVYLSACEAAFEQKEAIRILSIGCGDGNQEIDIAKNLIQRGHEQFQITGIDLSQILLARFADAIQANGLESQFHLLNADLNQEKITGPFDVVMAHHSLHHIVELEQLFDLVHREMSDHGIFATIDMIGRNGHMRWPETKAVVDVVWPLLKPHQRYQAQLKRDEPVFMDHDCSTEGFEGIRSQDILPLIMEQFHASKFVGLGGFIDLFVDRGYGRGFDVNNASDVELIKCLADLNEIMLDRGAVKPTMMMAHFVKNPCQEQAYRGRTAKNSIRAVPVPETAIARLASLFLPLIDKIRRQRG